MTGSNDSSRFVVFTRGRTGSTAIVDEINKHTDVMCMQELFIPLRMDPTVTELYERYGTDFSRYGLDGWFPSFALWMSRYSRVNLIKKVFYREGRKFYQKRQLAGMYLDEYADYSRDSGFKASGFKVLEHQVEDISQYFSLLHEMDFKFIYLERDVVRQVISGVIANKRNRYNAIGYTPDDKSYHIDVDDFRFKVMYEMSEVLRQKLMLVSLGVDLLVVKYEDFMADRERFFRRLFGFLDVEHQLPESSDFSIMIPRVEDVVENYDEIRVCLDDLGISASPG